MLNVFNITLTSLAYYVIKHRDNLSVYLFICWYLFSGIAAYFSYNFQFLFTMAWFCRKHSCHTLQINCVDVEQRRLVFEGKYVICGIEIYELGSEVVFVMY
jgi:hypothetical protein